MSYLSKEKCKSFLKEYFSDIVYIDNDFSNGFWSEYSKGDTIRVEETVEIRKKGLKKNKNTTTFLETVNEDFHNHQNKSNDLYVNLGKLIMCLNDEKYSTIKLTPIIYNSEKVIQNHFVKIYSSNLIVIDWKLNDSGETAYSFIDCLLEQEKDDKLKVFVVYTSVYLEAKRVFENKYKDYQYGKYDNGKEYSYCVIGNHIIFLTSKENDLNCFIDKVSDVFIKEFGIMAVATLKYVYSLSRNNDYIVKEFKKPMDSLYWAQIMNSILGIDDIPNLISVFIHNKIKTNEFVDNDICDEFRFEQGELILSQKKNFIDNCIMKKKSFKEKEKVKKELETCDSDPWKVMIDNKAQSIILKMFLDKSLEKIGSDEKKSVTSDFVKNLQFFSYNKMDNDNSLENILNKSYNDLNYDNIFHIGDIFETNFSDIEQKEYLLCITPPCDLFRTCKIENHIMFICGKQEHEYDDQKTEKESEHISCYIKSNEVIYIKWRFYDVVVLDLNNTQDVELLKKYKRNVRLLDSYIRQIVAKYTSYISRSGVDELIFKDNNINFLFPED